MRKALMFMRRLLKSPNVTGSLFLVVMTVLMGKFYFELGLVDRLILVYNMTLFLLVSGYLLLNESMLKKKGKSITFPATKWLSRITKNRIKERKKKDVLGETNKSNIYYSRTYRHLKPNYIRMSVFFLFFVIPFIILYLLSYSDISNVVSNFTISMLNNFIDASELGIASGDFLPRLGPLYYVTVNGPLPAVNLSLAHIIITAALLLVNRLLFRKHLHVQFYLYFVLMIHLSSALYMYFAAPHFPYDLVDYSELYMKQQIGVWLSIFSIVTLLSGALNYTGISKFVYVSIAILYSSVFGIIRYIVFLGILSKFSLIYMTSFFFSFGPFIDFLYLVWMYSIFMRYLTKRFGYKEGRVEWHWA